MIICPSVWFDIYVFPAILLACSVARQRVGYSHIISRSSAFFTAKKPNPIQRANTMSTHTIPSRFDLRSCFSLPLSKKTRQLRLRGLSCIVACSLMALAATAVAQKAEKEPTLVPGSEVNLAAITSADWVQGAGPTAFELDKVYVFECWATWCGPCVALIPHVNELHKKYYDKGLRVHGCLLYTSPSPRDRTRSRMPSSA